MKYMKIEAVLDRAEAVTGLLHECFEAQAQRRPNHPAVECNGETASYAELNARADRVARRLRAEGVQSGALVALYMVKSCDLFAALLGILKAGAGYVPIDPKFPVGRINSIIEDAGIGMVLDRSNAWAGHHTRHSGQKDHRRRQGRRACPGAVAGCRHVAGYLLRHLHVGLDGPPEGRRPRAPQRADFHQGAPHGLQDRRKRPHLPGIFGRLRRFGRGNLGRVFDRRNARGAVRGHRAFDL